MASYAGAQLGTAWGGEKHGRAGADSRSGSVVARHGSTLGQGIPYPVAGPKLGQSYLAAGLLWLGTSPREILVKENFSFYKNHLYFKTYLIQI
jgi:hypothetical protein